MKQQDACEMSGLTASDDRRIASEVMFADWLRNHPCPSVEHLRGQGFTCDPETGRLFRNGSEVACDPDGRGLMQFAFRSFCGHDLRLERARVVWALCKGSWAFANDHLNGVAADDRLVNLIDCLPSVAARNAAACRSGPPIWFEPASGLWMVRIWAVSKRGRKGRAPWVRAAHTRAGAEKNLREMLVINAALE
jgi:hypothetical protein